MMFRISSTWNGYLLKSNPIQHSSDYFPPHLRRIILIALFFSVAVVSATPAVARPLRSQMPRVMDNEQSNNKIDPGLRKSIKNSRQKVDATMRVLVRLKKTGEKMMPEAATHFPIGDKNRRNILHRLYLNAAENRRKAASNMISAAALDRHDTTNGNLKEYWLADYVALTVSLLDLERLATDPMVEAIVENKILSIPMIMGNETTADIPSSPWNLAKIGLDVNTSELDGSGVRIGLLDTGVNPTHLELSGKLHDWAEFDVQGRFVASIPHETTDIGHGTHVASILVGATTGVAPGASLLAALVLPGGHGTVEQIVAGLEWIVDPDGNPKTDDGAHIVNMSFGMSDFSIVLAQAIDRLNELEVLPVCAIGNSGITNTQFPGNYTGAVGVGSVDQDDIVASSSSGEVFYAASGEVVKPDISAPGVDIVGADAGTDASYRYSSGTSFAAPHVAGAAALVRQDRPDIGLNNLKKYLINSSLDLGSRGVDIRYGVGRLDVAAALSFVDAYEVRENRADLIVEEQRSLPGYRLNIVSSFFSDGQRNFLADDRIYSFWVIDNDLQESTTLGIVDVTGDGLGDLVTRQTEALDDADYLESYIVRPGVEKQGFPGNGIVWHTIYGNDDSSRQYGGMADLNGDKKTDLIVLERLQGVHDLTFKFYGRLSNGTGFETDSNPWTTISIENYSTLEFAFGDLNGDNMADLVLGVHYLGMGYGYPTYYLAALSDGSSFGNLTYWTTVFPFYDGTVPQFYKLADADGDGLSDLILLADAPYTINSTFKYLYVLPSNGRNRFGSSELWTIVPADNEVTLVGFADTNGDMADDLVLQVVEPETGRQIFIVWLSDRKRSFIQDLEPWLILEPGYQGGSRRIVGITDAGLGDWQQ